MAAFDQSVICTIFICPCMTWPVSQGTSGRGGSPRSRDLGTDRLITTWVLYHGTEVLTNVQQYRTASLKILLIVNVF